MPDLKWVPLPGMSRRRLIPVILTCIVLAAAFAAWTWLRPYAWNPDPGARCAVVETEVRRDQSYYWVHVHLKVTPGLSHDLEKPVRLETSDGSTHLPADSTFGAIEGSKPQELWFKFWLDAKDLKGPLMLHLNDGNLVLKSTIGFQDLAASGSRNFTTNRW